MEERDPTFSFFYSLINLIYPLLPSYLVNISLKIVIPRWFQGTWLMKSERAFLYPDTSNTYLWV